jgi:anti-sigma B factor antagonist
MSGPAPTEFSIATDRRDGRLVVTLQGELDVSGAPQLEEAVLPEVRDGAHVVLDLRGLEFMDSSGVRVLVAAHATAQDGAGRFSVVPAAAGGPVQRVIEISGLEDILDLVESPGS